MFEHLCEPSFKPFPEYHLVFTNEHLSRYESILDESENEEAKQNKYVKQFMTKFDEIVNKILEDWSLLKLSQEAILDLVEFMFKFKAIFSIDFYADKLTTNLLRQLYMDTEKVPETEIHFAKQRLGLLPIESENVVRQKEFTGLDMNEFI